MSRAWVVGIVNSVQSLYGTRVQEEAAPVALEPAALELSRKLLDLPLRQKVDGGNKQKDEERQRNVKERERHRGRIQQAGPRAFTERAAVLFVRVGIAMRAGCDDRTP